MRKWISEKRKREKGRERERDRLKICFSWSVNRVLLFFFFFFFVSFPSVSSSFFWDRTTQDLAPLWASDLFSTPRIVRTWKRWKAFRKWRACLNFTWSIVLSTWFIGNTAFRECNTGHDSLEPCAITSVTCMTVRVIKSVGGK